MYSTFFIDLPKRRALKAGLPSDPGTFAMGPALRGSEAIEFKKALPSNGINLFVRAAPA